jgi:Mn-dependent DtxR family transcriptional regulator
MFHIAVQPRRRLIAFGTQVEFLKNHKLISWLCIKFLSDCCWTCWYVKLLCSDEAQLKRRIVLAVQNASPVGLLQQVVQHRVGLQESVAEVVKQLGRVGILGIVGMGGIGKTTLAKEVYNEFAKRQNFERQTFLQNVRTTDLLTLQKQLVHDLLGDELKFTEEFHNCFARLSRDRKVLIVLDDMDHRSKFDCLIPSLTKLMSQGSRIIVTSRDRNVLNFITSQGSTGKSNLYEVPVLNGVHAQQLFNWHAFYSEQASDRFRDLAKEVADACGGLPLALEVMGAYLFDKKDPKHEVVWKEATRSLTVDPGGIDQKLQNMFNISYEGLSSLADKLMLLDISCFMINWHENVAMSFWESCISCTCPSSKSPHSSLMRLIDKSLVKVSQKGYLQMHDVIRDMARDVVRRQSLQEVGERSHLCDFIEAKEVLENDKVNHSIYEKVKVEIFT